MKDIWDAIENEGHGERLEEEMFVFLSAFADGETDARERRLVEAYLREEPDAQRLLGFIRSTDAALAADTVDSPNGLAEAIFAKTARKPVLCAGSFGRLAAAFGAAAAVLTVAWVLRSEPPTAGDLASLPPAMTRGGAEATLPHPVSQEGSTLNPSGASQTVTQPVVSTKPGKPAGTRERRHRLAADTHRQAPSTSTNSGSGAMVMASGSNSPRMAPAPASFQPPTPTVYSGEEPVTVRAEPKPIDPMAMEQPSQEDRRTAGDRDGGANAEKPQVLPDAREKLREALQKANEERDDLNDSSLNAPRKKLGNTRGVTQ